MADVGMFAEEESHTRNPVNNEEGNPREGEIWVNVIKVKMKTPLSYNKMLKN